MEKFCTLLLTAFISMSSLAAGMGGHGLLLQLQETQEINKSFMTGTIFLPGKEKDRMGLSLHIEQRRLPLFGTVIGGSHAEMLNKLTLTYRLSDRVEMGLVREGSFGRGIGFEYRLIQTRHMTVWGGILHNPDSGGRIPMIGIKGDW